MLLVRDAIAAGILNDLVRQSQIAMCDVKFYMVVCILYLSRVLVVMWTCV